jgi:hypothetical protein
LWQLDAQLSLGLGGFFLFWDRELFLLRLGGGVVGFSLYFEK